MADGLCECGCGLSTSIARANYPRRGDVAGRPRRFRRGHHRRQPPERRVCEVPGKLDTPCWLWTGQIDHNGYPFFKVGSKRPKAHRYIYELRFGPVPKGMHVHHKCNTRACVNPDHLEVVTPLEHKARHAAMKGASVG